MPECQFCDDNVSMPYTCSLCSSKHCSKHRLPESHDCSNISHFSTDVYRKQKIEKSRMPLNTITFADSYGSPMYGGQPGTWTSGNVNKDVVIGGLILGIASAMYHFIKHQNFEVVLGSLIYGVFGLLTIFQFRKALAKRYEIVTMFMLWPIGIALTIITSILDFHFLAFGYFINKESSSLRSEAVVGYGSAISIFILYIFGNILIEITQNAFIHGFALAADTFIFFGLINVLPFNFLDGKKMYEYNNRNYFIFMITMVFTVVYLAVNVF